MNSIFLDLLIVSLTPFLFIYLTGYLLLAKIRINKQVLLGCPSLINLTAISIGVIINAFFFLLIFILYRAGVVFNFSLIPVVFLLFLILINLKNLHLFAQKFSKLSKSFIFLNSITVIIGFYFLYKFPHVFDSGQLLWTQQFLWKYINLFPSFSDTPGVAYSNFGTIEPMFGYSGLLVLVGGFLPKLPLVTVASSLKPFLFFILINIIFMISSLYEIKQKILFSLLVFLVILSSFFGYWFYVGGKDSIFGISLLCGSLFLLMRNKVFSSAILFSASSSLGVIVVPYFITAFAIWFVSNFNKNLNENIYIFFICNCITAPIIIAYFSASNPIYIYSFYFITTLLLYRIKNKRFFFFNYEKFNNILKKYKLMWVLLLASSIILMPVSSELIPWIDIHGNPVIELRKPLDGKTNFFEMFLYGNNMIQNFVSMLYLFLFVFICTPLTKYLSTKNDIIVYSLLPLFAMPIAAIFVSLVHIHLNLKILTGFQLWDLVKDVPNWLGGSLLVLMVNVFLFVNFEKYILNNRIFKFAFNVIILGLFIFMSSKIFYTTNFDVIYRNNVGINSQYKNMAIVSDEILNNFINKSIFIEEDIIPGYFYSTMMFGARPNKFTYDMFDTTFNLEKYKDLGLVVNINKIPLILQYANSKNASVYFISYLSSNNNALINLKFDKLNKVNLPRDFSQYELIDGDIHAMETIDEINFKWVGSEISFRSSLFENDDCRNFQLLMINPSTVDNPKLKIQTVYSDGKIEENIVDFSFSINGLKSPNFINIVNKKRINMIRLQFLYPPIQFPNDSRKISSGLIFDKNKQNSIECK